MKNKKGFTLIELLAVVVILGVIMTIAIPNVTSTIDKNKKETFIEDAKKIVSATEYKIRSDTKIEYPSENTITVLSLEKIGTDEISVSPFDTEYSKKLSFVAITKEPSVDSGSYEYKYYIHLVACVDQMCELTDEDSIAKNRGIILRDVKDLNTSERFDLVVKGSEVSIDLINNDPMIRKMLNKDSINYYR